MRCMRPSIQPKQSASSSASDALSVFGPPDLPNTSHTPPLASPLSPNHALNSSRVENVSSSSIRRISSLVVVWHAFRFSIKEDARAGTGMRRIARCHPAS